MNATSDESERTPPSRLHLVAYHRDIILRCIPSLPLSFYGNLLLSFPSVSSPRGKPIEKRGEGGSRGRESFHEEGGVSRRSSYADTHARLTWVHGMLTASSSFGSRAKRRSLLGREQTLGSSVIRSQGRGSCLVYLVARPPGLID